MLVVTPWVEGEAAITYEEGRFEAAARPRSRIQCVASKPGFVTDAGPPIVIHGDIDAGTLVLRRNALGIAGRVVAPDGRGVPSVEVRIFAEAPDEAWARRHEAFADVAVQSDGNGAFRFEGLPEGRYRLEAWVPHPVDDLRLTTEHVPAGARDVRIVVPTPFETDQPIRVTLSVALLDGSPLPAAAAQLWDAAGQCSRAEAVVAGEAVVEYQGTPPFTLVVFGPRDASGERLPLRPAVLWGLLPGDHERELRLEAGDEIRGSVLDGSAPVSGATVTAWLTAAGAHRWIGNARPPDELQLVARMLGDAFVATTGADGTFVLRGVVPGCYAVTADAPALRPYRNSSWRTPETATSWSPCGASCVDRCASWRPPANGWPAGRLLVSKRAREGATIVRTLSVSLGRNSARSEFSATLEALDAGETYELRVTVDARFASETLDFIPSDRPITVALHKGPPLEGRVSRTDGSPVPGATVAFAPLAWEGDSLDAPSVEVTTDAIGRFAVGCLSREPLRVAASAPGLAQLADITVAPGAGTIEIRLVPAVEISGRLVGDPPLDQRVEFWTVSGGASEQLVAWEFAGTDGFFSQGALAPREYRVVVWNPTRDDDDRQFVAEPIRAGTRGLRPRLAPGRRIEGVVLGRDGTPRPSVIVRVDAGDWRRSVWTDAEGRFTVRGVPEGRYRVFVPSGGPGATTQTRTGSTVVLRIDD